MPVDSSEFGTMLRYPLGWVSADGQPFDSPTGMPYMYVNLRTGKTRGARSNPAEIGTLITALVTGFTASWLFEFSTLEGLLLGAVVAAHWRAGRTSSRC